MSDDAQQQEGADSSELTSEHRHSLIGRFLVGGGSYAPIRQDDVVAAAVAASLHWLDDSWAPRPSLRDFAEVTKLASDGDVAVQALSRALRARLMIARSAAGSSYDVESSVDVFRSAKTFVEGRHHDGAVALVRDLADQLRIADGEVMRLSRILGPPLPKIEEHWSVVRVHSCSLAV